MLRRLYCLNGSVCTLEVTTFSCLYLISRLFSNTMNIINVGVRVRKSLHCALAAAQCIALGPVCLFVGVWVGLFPR